MTTVDTAIELAKKNCKQPDKTPMTDARKLALKKGELLRTYCNIISQIHRIQKLTGDIKAMSDEKIISGGLYYLNSSAEFLIEQENNLRKELGQVSKEESRERQLAKANAKHIRYLQAKHGKENVVLEAS